MQAATRMGDTPSDTQFPLSERGVDQITLKRTRLQEKVQDALHTCNQELKRNHLHMHEFARKEMQQTMRGRVATQEYVVNAQAKRQELVGKSAALFEKVQKSKQDLDTFNREHPAEELRKGIRIEELDPATFRETDETIQALVGALLETNKVYAAFIQSKFDSIPKSRHASQGDQDDKDYVDYLVVEVRKATQNDLKSLLAVQGLSSAEAGIPQGRMEEAINQYIELTNRIANCFIHYVEGQFTLIKSTKPVTQFEANDTNYLNDLKQSVSQINYATIQSLVAIRGKVPPQMNCLWEQLAMIQQLISTAIDQYSRASSTANQNSVDYVKQQFRAAKAGHAVFDLDQTKDQYMKRLNELLVEMGHSLQSMNKEIPGRSENKNYIDS